MPSVANKPFMLKVFIMSVMLSVVATLRFCGYVLNCSEIADREETVTLSWYGSGLEVSVCIYVEIFLWSQTVHSKPVPFIDASLAT
jgi:hypothetical protein